MVQLPSDHLNQELILNKINYKDRIAIQTNF